MHKYMIYEMEDANLEDLLLKDSKQMVPKKLKILTIFRILKDTLKTGNLPHVVESCVCNYI